VTLPLTELLATGDLDEVDHYLRTVEGVERAEAKAWFEGNRRWFRIHINASYDGWGGGGLERANSTHWLEGLCAVALCGPVTAAKRMPWSDIWDYQEFPGEAVFVHRLWDAEPAWAADFVSAASEVGLGGDARNCNENLSRVLRSVVLHHGLPTPTGATFHGAWLAPMRSLHRWRNDETPHDRLLGFLRDNPLMPDLLYHFVASGHAGSHPELATATAVLVDEGLVERARVLDVVLEQLTGSQRVASQRVLAALARELQLTAAEIPGGIAYLTGVLATSDGSVGLVLLPKAVELVTTADELSELVTVIAGRPERKQKELLLRALQGQLLRERIGDGGLAAALNLLAADDDAGLRTKVATVLASLGHTPSAATPAATGLWQTEPQPGPPTTGDWWWRHRASEPVSCLRVLSNDPRYGGGDGPGVLSWGLRQILLGNLPISQVVAEAGVLLATGQLALPRTAQLFEELFLSGGMRLAWAAALAVADAACGMTPRPAGLVVLLRMLATYAPEAPGQELPQQLARFAAATGSSKAQQEVRSIGAVLAGSSVADYCSQLRLQPPSADTGKHQGLWSTAGADAWLVSARLDPARNVPLDQLVSRVGEDRRADYGWVGDWDVPAGFAGSSLLLHDLVAAIGRHGAQLVRQSLLRIDLPVGSAGPVRLAAELWAADVLTVPAYWRLALAAGASREADTRMGSVWDDLRGLRRPTGLRDPDSSDQMLARFEGPGVQFIFLLACECLLLAGRAPAPLSTPSYEDGSLDFDDLIARLRQREDGAVGPLDLLQSLYRLRPLDPSRAADLASLNLFTAAEVTSPDGVALDVVSTLRSWLAQGGLPDVVAVPTDGARPRWRFDADPRVQLPWLDVAYGGLPAVTTNSARATCAIIFPLWPDVLLDSPFAELIRPEPGYLTCLSSRSGKLGVPAHDYLLASLSQPSGVGRAVAVQFLIRLARQDRLNAQSAVQAALGRWAAGTLPLARSIPCWEQVLLGGGFPGAWPTFLAIADAGCSLSPRPTALPGLLSMLADYGHEVPDPVVPPHIHNLAAEKADTRGQTEARALVAALTRPQQRT
jgi:hypothetical protein